ncbi:MAG: MFS transporter, partial [Erysipelotrichaceae bacterium]
MGKNKVVEPTVYHRAKTWQMALFAFNNTATNLYMILLGYVSYYLVGFIGVGTVFAGSLIMSMRIWDGVTDPFVGYIVDKTNGKFGKNRPFIVIGNIIMAITVTIMFTVTHTLPDALKLPFFIIMYAIYILGYTSQCVVTKSAQSCMTNDPKQRPTFSIFDGIYNTVVFTGFMILVTGVLVPMYGGFTIEFFNTLLTIVVSTSAFMTVLAVIGLWSKDRSEFYGTGKPQLVTFKDYWRVLKENRALQMLVVAASSDKLAFSIANNAVVMVMLYGIICGNYAYSGQIGLYTMLPILLILFYGVGYIARKLGQRKALLYGSIVAIIFILLSMGLFFVFDPKSLGGFNTFTILYLTFTVLGKGASGVAGAVVIPMTADCADYETYRSGKYVPGLMGTLFSAVDKIISSFSSAMVGVAIAAIGFTTTQPTI